MTGLNRPAADADAPILRPEFIPRRGGNFAIPESGIFDEPLVCFKVNAQWLSHLIGVIDALDQPDAWSGTENAIENARAEVRKLISSMESCDEVITDLRINNCIIEVYVSGEWLPKADITSCVNSLVGGAADEEFRDREWDEPTEAERPPAIPELDCVWGGVTNLVNYIFQITTVALDILESVADAAEAAGDFVGTVPGFNLLPPQRAFDAFSVASNIGVAVARLALIPEVNEMIACDLFCRIRNAGAPYQITDQIYSEWIDWIFDQSEQILDQPYAIGMGFIAQTARDLVGRRYAYARYILGTNNCDSDWELLCGECVEATWCYEFDFRVSDGGWFVPPTPARGVWQAGSGWVQSNGNNSCGAYIAYNFQQRIVTKVTMTYSLTSGNLNRGGTIFLVDDGTTIDTASVPPTNGSDLELVWTGSESVDQIQLNVNSRFPASSCPGGEVATIHKVKIEGTGLNPFGGDNC